MSTKQIEKIKVSKEQLEQDINDSWKEFLENGYTNIENPKNFFTRYIQEVYGTFGELNLKKIISLGIGAGATTFYDFSKEAIIQVSRNNKPSLAFTIILGIIGKTLVQDLSDEKINYFIKAVYDKLPSSGGTI